MLCVHFNKLLACLNLRIFHEQLKRDSALLLNILSTFQGYLKKVVLIAMPLWGKTAGFPANWSLKGYASA